MVSKNHFNHYTLYDFELNIYSFTQLLFAIAIEFGLIYLFVP